VSVSYGNSPRRETRDIATAETCLDSAQSPNIASLRAGRPTAVSGLPSTAPELAPGDSDVARSAAQVRDGLDVDQMCWHITWRCACGAVIYGPALTWGSLRDGPAHVR
jgi:hypothetical protein